jgi:uncharacterized beta-barrel protein YwiB (DUF1934 family)
MKENCIITISGRRQSCLYANDANHNKIHINTPGTHVKKGNSDYIIYNEYDEFNLQKPNIAIFKVNTQKKTVTMIKSGHVSSKFTLEYKKRHHCYCNTEYGSVVLGIFTYKMNAHFSKSGGELNMMYSLDINSGLESVNEINVKVRRINS